MKVLAYILTAAAVLIGADVFVMSAESEATGTATVMSAASSPTTNYGGNGAPPPPPD